MLSSINHLLRIVFVINLSYTPFLLGISPEEQAWVRRSINSLLNKQGLSRHVGITITSLRDQTPWYTHAAQETFVPASNQKLCTSAAALWLLGPEHRFTTKLLTNGYRKRSTLVGTLFLKGSGDPTLTHQAIQGLIRQLKRQKIRHIRGNLALDLSNFDMVSFHPYWFGSYRNKGWCPHVTALLVDRSCSPRYINMLVRRACKRYGIMLTGKLILRKAPETAAVLATHQSEPLKEIIKPLLKRSDNLYAECLFKTIGAERFGAPGTWEKGSKAVIEILQEHIGIDASRIHIVDGSGISHKNQLAPDNFTSLLCWCRSQPFFKDFLDALPTAGRDGTLKYRMTQPGIATHIKAKTGTLSDVSSLSGYIIAHDKTPLVFSIMSNKVMGKSEQHKRLEDKICALLANFSSTAPDVIEAQDESDQVDQNDSDQTATEQELCTDAQECDQVTESTEEASQEQVSEQDSQEQSQEDGTADTEQE